MITRSAEEAARVKADTDWFWNTWGVPFGLGAPEMLVGDVDFVTRRIEYALETLGTDEMFFLIGDGLLPHDLVTHTLDEFGSKVLPRFS